MELSLTLDDPTGQVTRLPVDGRPMISGDGRIAVVGESAAAYGPFRLTVVDLASSTLGYRSPEDQPVTDFSLSADGRRIGWALDDVRVTDTAGYILESDPAKVDTASPLLAPRGLRTALTEGEFGISCHSNPYKTYDNGQLLGGGTGLAATWLGVDRLLILREAGYGPQPPPLVTSVQGDGLFELPMVPVVLRCGRGARVQADDAGTVIYHPSLNAVYDTKTGAQVWRATRSGGSSGALIGNRAVAYVYRGQVIVEPLPHD